MLFVLPSHMAHTLTHLYNSTNMYAVKHVFCLQNLENKNVFLQPLKLIVSLLNQNYLDCVNGTDVQCHVCEFSCKF